MGGYWYVYVLVCDGDNERHYTGVTQKLTDRVKEHNRGKCSATAAFRPWTVQTAIAFNKKGKARSFERYLKTGSGREFARRHF
jgi:predicted GIY-YIG superfamily endonuclease